MGHDMDQQIPPSIEKRLSSWNLVASLLRFLHVSLGLMGVLCPLVVASFADAMPTPIVRIVSFAGAAAIGIFVAFDIGAVTNRFREAWKLLNAACIRFQCGSIDLKALEDAYEEGEKRIGPMKANPFQSPRHKG